MLIFPLFIQAPKHCHLKIIPIMAILEILSYCQNQSNDICLIDISYFAWIFFFNNPLGEILSVTKRKLGREEVLYRKAQRQDFKSSWAKFKNMLYPQLSLTFLSGLWLCVDDNVKTGKKKKRKEKVCVFFPLQIIFLPLIVLSYTSGSQINEVECKGV